MIAKKFCTGGYAEAEIAKAVGAQFWINEYAKRTSECNGIYTKHSDDCSIVLICK